MIVQDWISCVKRTALKSWHSAKQSSWRMAGSSTAEQQFSPHFSGLIIKEQTKHEEKCAIQFCIISAHLPAAPPAKSFFPMQKGWGETPKLTPRMLRLLLHFYLNVLLNLLIYLYYLYANRPDDLRRVIPHIAHNPQVSWAFLSCMRNFNLLKRSSLLHVLYPLSKFSKMTKKLYKSPPKI